MDVAEKLNEWYKVIQNYDLEKSHSLQNEIKNLLQHMEEDQNVLLYYSLLDFRARLNDQNVERHENITDALQKLENRKDHLTGILSYYYSFFKGMYEFKNHNYSSAISYYKVAEEKVNQLNDEIEKATCFYKLSQVYYRMQYTGLSIAYAKMALKIYNKHPDYSRQVFFSELIVAGNLLDQYQFDEAISTFVKASKLSIIAKDRRLDAIVSLNIGIGYNLQSLYQEAEPYIKKAYSLFQALNDRYVSKTLFNLMESYVKRGLRDKAESAYKEGIKQASQWNDTEFIAKLNLIRELLPGFGDKLVIDHEFSTLKELNLYPDIEDYSVDFARHFQKVGDTERAVKYYELNLSIRKMMKEGKKYET
nr:hypothetical protein [Sporolactobacillus pectinivorans]